MFGFVRSVSFSLIAKGLIVFVLKALVWISLFNGLKSCDQITREENCRHCYPYENLIGYDRALAKLCWDLCEIDDIDETEDICD